jgi:hypothetical protein
VLVRGRGIVVCDWVDGVSPLTFAVHWPLGDEPNTRDMADSSLMTSTHSIAWSIHGNSLQVDASIEPLRRSPGYGRECDGQLLRLAYSGAAPASVATCFTDAHRPLRVQGHDGLSIRISISGDTADETSQLVIAPGATPSVSGSRASLTSMGAVG